MNHWIVYALGSAIFAALTAILGKVGVEGVSSNFATFIRTVAILVVSGLLVSARSEWQPLSKLSSKTLIFLTLSGIATGFSWLCYYRALQLGPVSRVAPVDKLSVAFAMILAFFFLGETISWQTFLGGALIVSGSLVIVFANA